MGKFDGILIVSDIDGTFLGYNGRIVEKNVEKIKYFNSEGGRFTFATGRPHMNVINNIPPATSIISAPGIMANGGYLYDFAKGERMEEDFLNVEWTREILKYVEKEYPQVEFRITTRKGNMAPRLDGPYISREIGRLGHSTYFQYPLDEIPGYDWYKVVLRGDAEDVDNIRSDVNEKFSGKVNFTKSDPTYLEMLNIGTSKAKKMKRLKELYSEAGTPVTVYAAGDYENDYEMLTTADYAACPTNALGMIKEIADFSPCNNDEGLIAALIDIIEKER